VSIILETREVCKTYGSSKAADHISLQIPQGSIYGLLGPNGAGKTTLIRMLTTITKPDTGLILFKGEPLQENHASRMGYMPEERGLYKKMSVLDQLLFFAEIKGVKPQQAKITAKKWLARLDMQTWENKKIEELSKGMAQKVQFLTTIIHNPEFIILDEPFSGFDPVNADLIKDLILELNKNGATLLFSTHRMDNVEELCDYLCIVDHGQVKLNGEAGGLRRKMFKNQYEVGYLKSVSFLEDYLQPISSVQTADGRNIYTFQLQNSSEVEILLSLATKKGDLIHFSEALPTIHQIFVDTIKNNSNG